MLHRSDLALALAGNRLVDPRQPGVDRIGGIGGSGGHRRAALADSGVERFQPRGKAVGGGIQRGLQRVAPHRKCIVDRSGFIHQRAAERSGAFFKLAQPFARIGDQLVMIAAHFLDRAGQASCHFAHIAIERADPRGQRGQAFVFGAGHDGALVGQFAGQRLGPGADRRQRGDLFAVDAAALRLKRVDHFAQAYFARNADAFGRPGKGIERGLDSHAHLFDLAPARAAEFVEPVEPGDQFFELGIGGVSGVGDGIGGILGRIADHRQMRAQRGNVFQRLGGNGADLIHIAALPGDQVFEPLCRS